MPSKIPSHAPNKAEERKQLKAASEKTDSARDARSKKKKKKNNTTTPIQQPPHNLIVKMRRPASRTEYPNSSSKP